MTTVYLSIGNSDDKLSQQEWAQFCTEVDQVVRGKAAHVFGVWYSAPATPWQNACWCFEVAMTVTRQMKAYLEVLREKYRQDSIAWAVVATTTLLGQQVMRGTDAV